MFLLGLFQKLRLIPENIIIHRNQITNEENWLFRPGVKYSVLETK